jgi:hypothetical protein
MDVGSADIAGENICHPCRLDCSIHATDNLEYRASFSNDSIVWIFNYENIFC